MLRTLPRDADECVCDEGMLFRQLVKTVTHIVDLPKFVQVALGCTGYAAFLGA